MSTARSQLRDGSLGYEVPNLVSLACSLWSERNCASADPVIDAVCWTAGRAIKALSEEDTASLLTGEGLGMAKAAELNDYPGPAHVLALAKDLKLSDQQRKQVQGIFDQITRAVALGSEIVERERALDQQFARREATNSDVVAETVKIAALRGQLRSAHLEAHLATRPLHNPDQLVRYQQLRGYGGPGSAAHHHHG